LRCWRRDHATVKKLFEQEDNLKKRDSEKQAGTFSQIKDALEVHATIEEEIFYPGVNKARSQYVKDEVREGYEEHKQNKDFARRNREYHARRRDLRHED
jgi:hemerythrin superfamily protein